MPLTFRMPSACRSRDERGVALITAVIMLLVITLLAISGARIALDSKKTSRNQRDYEIAFQAAEAALRDAELDISSATGPAKRTQIFSSKKRDGFDVPGGCNTGTAPSGPYLGLCDTYNSNPPIWNTVDWTATVGQRTVEYGTFTGRSFPTGSGLTPGRKPRYLIEIMTDRGINQSASNQDEVKFMYQITAVGFGPNDTTRAVVQSLYYKGED
ncbi:pilus assembly PilX family protein [Cupriavidus campinensis]|uniref:pilus assembly PilX family protein n=1 Tax=Cupriavidus campinensis TaxID=151783 RepID=UPI0021CD16B2|nr:pilus assembly protein [Cupriavidus campinensis]